MRPPSHENDELDLPPLDGAIGGVEEEGAAHPDDDELDDAATRDVPDALDDATGETREGGDAFGALSIDGAEVAWLLEQPDDAKAVDVGTFDLGVLEQETQHARSNGTADDEGEHGHPPDDELGDDEDEVHNDGGEEGPLADDEELREEDLPSLDADEDGDVDDASLYEGASIGLGPDEELRWADRAWARVGQTRLADLDAPPEIDLDDSGMLAVPGDDPKLALRDAAWRKLDEAGRITAVAFVPGDSVVVAVDGPDRPMLVRILPDGVARIIAEIETADDEQTLCRVSGLRWDAGRGSLVATGTFGAQAFRPA